MVLAQRPQFAQNFVPKEMETVQLGKCLAKRTHLWHFGGELWGNEGVGDGLWGPLGVFSRVRWWHYALRPGVWTLGCLGYVSLEADSIYCAFPRLCQVTCTLNELQPSFDIPISVIIPQCDMLAEKDPVSSAAVPPNTAGGDPDRIEQRADGPHLEAVMSGGSGEKPTIAADGYYVNFAPIAELNLPDWRATEKSLVRRLDMTLLPTVWILYLNNYLDRTNIAQARLNSFEQDVGLTGDDYNTAVAVLTVGYMLAQLPSNMLLTRVRPSVYLPVTAIVWSAVSATTAATSSPQTLFVVRFFLGILEAPLFPGVRAS